MESEKQTLYLHCIMCILGGFLGAYAILCRLMNFGSSQTANMIDILCTLFEGDVTDFLLRLSGLVLYVLAMVICLLLTKKTALNVKRYAIFIDMAGLILLTFIPGDINPILGILPIFFMMATQWSVFSGNGEFNSSTIFSTNNLKQFTFALTNYVMEREKAQLRKAKFFGTSLLCYHIGVIFSFFAFTNCCIISYFFFQILHGNTLDAYKFHVITHFDRKYTRTFFRNTKFFRFLLQRSFYLLKSLN